MYPLVPSSTQPRAAATTQIPHEDKRNSFREKQEPTERRDEEEVEDGEMRTKKKKTTSSLQVLKRCKTKHTANSEHAHIHTETTLVPDSQGEGESRRTEHMVKVCALHQRRHARRRM